MATVRPSPRNPKKYEVRYRSPDGKQRTKGGFTTKSDAKAYAATVEHRMRTGEWRDPALGRITVEKWCEEYLAGCTDKRESTLRRDRQAINGDLLPAIGGVPMAAVTPRDIKAIIDPLSDRLAPSTIRGIYGTIATIFRTAVDADVIVQTPCRAVKRPKERPSEKRFLDADEMLRLADAIDPSYRPFVYLGGVLGLRFSEIAGLRVRSIDFLRRTITVFETIAEDGGTLSTQDTKSKQSRRTVGVPQRFVDDLAQFVAGEGLGLDDYLLRMPRGGPLRYSNFHRTVWAPAVKRAGLEGLTPHGLRHSAVGLMIAVGAHPRVIQQRLGHSSITTTMNVYGSILPAVEDGVTSALGALFDDESGADVVQRGAGDQR